MARATAGGRPRSSDEARYHARVSEPTEPSPTPEAPRLTGLGAVDRGPAGPSGAPTRPSGGGLPLPLLIFLLSIILVVVGLAAVWRQPGFPGASAPPASASATATEGPSPTATATAASGSADPGLAAAIAQVEAQVAALRDLQPTREVPSRVIGEQQLAAELTQRFREENPHERIAAQGAFLQRLGLLPAGSDLEGLTLELLNSQVIGFYDDRTRTLSVVQRGSAFGPLGRTTIAHEYTHALQDQHFGLAGLGTDDPSDGDRALARLSLVEGDATLLMQLWTQAQLRPDEQAQLLQQAADPTQLALLARLPPFLVQQLLFPYEQGLAFVNGLRQAGGWAAVDAAYARPPDSSAQILHPELYAAHEQPLAVALDAAALAKSLNGRGDGPWTVGYTDTLGEFTLGQWLQRGVGADGSPAAVGWRGDRAAYLEGPAGHWYAVSRSAWASAAAARVFANAAGATLAGLAPQTDVAVGADGRTVTLSLADVPLVAIP